MKVYKVELLIVDFDEVGSSVIKQTIEEAHYPNHCIDPVVMNMEIRDIGEWCDDHPLNRAATTKAEYERLFEEGEKP